MKPFALGTLVLAAVAAAGCRLRSDAASAAATPFAGCYRVERPPAGVPAGFMLLPESAGGGRDRRGWYAATVDSSPRAGEERSAWRIVAPGEAEVEWGRGATAVRMRLRLAGRDTLAGSAALGEGGGGAEHSIRAVRRICPGDAP